MTIISRTMPRASLPAGTPADEATLTRLLHALTGGEQVRLAECFAALLANRLRAAPAWHGSGVRFWSDAIRSLAHETGVTGALASDNGLPGGRLACKRIARRAMAGVLADPTRGALAFHGSSDRPRWSLGRKPTAHVGGHAFYRL